MNYEESVKYWERANRRARLADAENEAARSDAAFEQLERARLRREARERRERIAAYEAKQAEAKAAQPAQGPQRRVIGEKRTTYGGRPCIEKTFSDGTREQVFYSVRDHTALAEAGRVQYR